MASTSFNKKVKANLRQIPGAKPSIFNNQLLISTGIPSLDTVLGGGVAVGTVLLLEEDVGGRYAEVMTRYFLAEGVVSHHALTVVSADQNPHKMLERLPAPLEEEAHSRDDAPPSKSQGAGSGGEADARMAIAWRYQHQPTQQPVARSAFGHYYNLSQAMSQDRVRSTSVECVDLSDLLLYENEHLDTLQSPHCRYHCLLQRIRRRIEEGKFATSAKCEKRNILRIAIQSLGSALWGDTGGAGDGQEGTALLQFLLALRAVLRTSFSVCLLTVPTYQFQNVALVKRVQRLCDTVLRLHSFSAALKTKNPAFRDYSGLLHVVKFPCLNELAPHMPDSLDLAFRCRRKKFTIENLHLPPELSDTASREQEDIQVSSVPPSLACSSGFSHLDF